MTDDDQFLADLHAFATRARASIPEGSAAPNSWQQVLATVNTTTETTTERRPSMHTNIAQPMHPVWEQSIPHHEQSRSFGGSIRHYANLAATVALVLAVAVGGWLAMSQMQPGEPNPKFAAMASPEVASSTCDVESMTVDEAMQIMENPYQVMDVDPESGSEYETWKWLTDQTGTTGPPPRDRIITEGPNWELSPKDLDKALELGDTYLSCLMNGTRGQVFKLMEPAYVHKYLREQLPLFTTEEEAMVLIEGILTEPANTVWTGDSEITYLENKTLEVNRKSEYQYVDSSSTVQQVMYSALVISPVVISNSDGEVVFETDFGGFPHTNNGRSASYARNVWIVQSVFDQQWYVYGIFAP